VSVISVKSRSLLAVSDGVVVFFNVGRRKSQDVDFVISNGANHKTAYVDSVAILPRTGSNNRKFVSSRPLVTVLLATKHYILFSQARQFMMTRTGIKYT
jgi:hypothetical protein